MFSDEQYMMAWLIYFAATLGVFLGFWRLTLILPLYLRQSLRLVLATVLLYPSVVSGTETYWGPAWVKVILEWVTKPKETLFDPSLLIEIAIAAALMVAFYIILEIVGYFILDRSLSHSFFKNKVTEPSKKTANQQQRIEPRAGLGPNATARPSTTDS